MRRLLRSGFTMVEVLVAMAFFVAFFLVVLGTWLLNARAASQARAVVVATHLAEQPMENCLSLGFAGAAPRQDVSAVPVDPFGSVPPLQFTTSGSVTARSSTVKDVLVDVRWQEGGVPRDLCFETLLCQNGSGRHARGDAQFRGHLRPAVRRGVRGRWFT